MQQQGEKSQKKLAGHSSGQLSRKSQKRGENGCASLEALALTVAASSTISSCAEAVRFWPLCGKERGKGQGTQSSESAARRTSRQPSRLARC